MRDRSAVDEPTSGEGLGEARVLSGPALRLLKAADTLFYSQGAPATTVREITNACGLSPGAMYNHFTSKDELLYVLVQYRHARLEEDVVAALAPLDGDPVAGLTAIVRVYVRMHLGGKQSAQVANREYRHLSGPQLEEVLAIRRRLRQRTVHVLKEGARTGAFDIWGRPESSSFTITAATILDMCIHSSQWLHEGGPMGIDELEHYFVTMAMRMVGCVDGV
ncbi:MAG TPA: TetR/AcrR family transcriptional regulator [Acidimicrobiales bacterium]|jgi:AcrR family transcriptional regulator